MMLVKGAVSEYTIENIFSEINEQKETIHKIIRARRWNHFFLYWIHIEERK